MWRSCCFTYFSHYSFLLYILIHGCFHYTWTKPNDIYNVFLDFVLDHWWHTIFFFYFVCAFIYVSLHIWVWQFVLFSWLFLMWFPSMFSWVTLIDLIFIFILQGTWIDNFSICWLSHLLIIICHLFFTEFITFVLDLLDDSFAMLFFDWIVVSFFFLYTFLFWLLFFSVLLSLTMLVNCMCVLLLLITYNLTCFLIRWCSWFPKLTCWLCLVCSFCSWSIIYDFHWQYIFFLLSLSWIL